MTSKTPERHEGSLRHAKAAEDDGQPDVDRFDGDVLWLSLRTQHLLHLDQHPSRPAAMVFHQKDES